MNPVLTRRQLLRSALALGAVSMSPKRSRAARLMQLPNQTLLDEADALIAGKIASREVAAAALLVRREDFEFARAYGAARPESPFLIASITKPMTASAVMLLHDRGELQLSDAVRKFLPRFTGGDRDRVTIEHLLTHTSGLPDMLPANEELRKRHAPLSAFVDATYTTPLLFRPGDKVSYQSMGILLAAAIVETITRQPLPEFLTEHVFGPLKMTRTSLGLGGRALGEMVRCQVSDPSDWDWNSAYWRNLGAPWGGAHSTTQDIAKLLEHFATTDAGPLRVETRRAMLAVHTSGLAGAAWGLGWLREPRKFSPACSAETYGHSGSTGTLAWHDPAAKLTFVFFNTKPAAESARTLISPVSDLVARSVRR